VTARLSVGVQDDRALQAAVLAFRVAGRDLKRRINTSTKEVFDPVWKSEVRSRAKTRLEERVLVPGTRVATGNPPTFVAGASRRKLKGGLVDPQVRASNKHLPSVRVPRAEGRIGPPLS